MSEDLKYYQKKGIDMSPSEKRDNISRIMDLDEFNCNKFLNKFKNDSLEKRVERVEKILGFIGALEKWEEQ